MALDATELLSWMVEVNANREDPPALEDAASIIAFHDDNNDRLMQYDELEAWFDAGSRMTSEQRLAVANKSPGFRRSIHFLEQVVHRCNQDIFLPPLNKVWLKAIFRQYDTVSFEARGG